MSIEHIGDLRRAVTYDTWYTPARPYFTIGSESVPADGERDVCLPIREDTETGQYHPEYPRCPDCGGVVVWAEAGAVPGWRACAGAVDDEGYGDGEGCGSRYIDTRYGVALDDSVY